MGVIAVAGVSVIVQDRADLFWVYIQSMEWWNISSLLTFLSSESRFSDSHWLSEIRRRANLHYNCVTEVGCHSSSSSPSPPWVSWQPSEYYMLGLQREFWNPGPSARPTASTLVTHLKHLPSVCKIVNVSFHIGIDSQMCRLTVEPPCFRGCEHVVFHFMCHGNPIQYIRVLFQCIVKHTIGFVYPLSIWSS